MRRYESPYLADWFAISLRWIMLIGVVVSLGLGGQLTLTSAWPLSLIVLWNLTMTGLARLNARMTYHRRIGLGVDLLLTGVFFGVEGGLAGPAFWLMLLPILTGAIYFEFWGALFASILSGTLIIFHALNQTRQTELSFAIALT